MIDAEYFLEQFQILISWIENEFLVTTTLIEIGIILLLYVISLLLKNRVNNSVQKGLKYIKILTVQQREKICDKILQPIIFALLLGIYLILAETLGGPILLVDIVANIVFALIVIRLTVIFLPRETLAVKIIFFLIWAVVLLNILGIYNQTTSILEEIRFASGNLSVSLMDIIRGVLLFGILFWLEGKVSQLISKRIKSSDSFTPSIKVLLVKLSKTALYIVIIFLTLSSLGMDLSSFAFLGGAIGVGLGFGLQKIVSNYISGLIILMDKSVKPGDIIEIDDVFGRIKAQETRFVSLVTRSGKEYLIPNESFITNQVINWSYSDDLVRVETRVGVSYDSDLHRVKKLLLQATTEKDRIVEYPPPNCLLTEFGNNTINFCLRFWIKDPAQGVANIKSDVLFSIWELLTENDIEIAYPQRDVHFKSISSEMATALNEFSPQKQESRQNNKKD